MSECINDGHDRDGVKDHGDGTFTVRDSGGGYVGVSSDGYEMLTPATTPEEALDDLAIAHMVDKAAAEGREPFVMEIGGSGEALDELITEFGFDPEDFRLP